MFAKKPFRAYSYDVGSGNNTGEMDPLTAILLFVGASLAGTINTIAGGGTLITVPLLVLAGLSPNVANGTNRLAVLAQSLVATATFKQKSIPFLRAGVIYLPTGLVGTAVGTYLATVVSNDTFRVLFGILMIPLAIGFALYRPPPSEQTTRSPTRSGWLSVVVFFFVGFYAGFIQAGVGVMILALLVLVGGFGVRRANAIKVFTVAVFAALSLFIFATELEIDWFAGAIVAMGAGLGGYVGSLSVIRHGGRFVRPVLVLVSVGLAIRMITG